MYSYRIFGGCLRSEIPFPELMPADAGQSDWTLRVSRSVKENPDAELIGSGLEPYCQIGLYREPKHLRLSHSCTGSFHISNSGRSITWSPAPSARVEAARADVFGRVLAVAMHLQGVLTLHASAVAFEGGAIAFIAPKHHGKSTLAMALTDAGARLVTDDMLPVRTGSPPTVVPGVQSVRLLADSAGKLLTSGPSGHIGVDGKHVIRESNSDRLLLEETPLEAIYILSPVQRLNEKTLVSRSRLSATSAAMSLVAHTKVGALLGKFGASDLLDKASKIARGVPVYRLHVIRDIDCITKVADEISAWHRIPVAVGV